MPKTAPYGSWKSPITSDLIVAQSIALSEARLDRGKVYWLEGRPQEQGRIAIVRADWLGGGITEITPEPHNVRTGGHEDRGRGRTGGGGGGLFFPLADGRPLRPGGGGPGTGTVTAPAP